MRKGWVTIRRIVELIARRRESLVSEVGVGARPMRVVGVEIEELTQGLTNRVDADDLEIVAQDVLEVAALCCEFLERFYDWKD